MKRVIAIDSAKGIAILMLLLSHCITGEGYLKIWIFSWHMPIFFIICGLLNQLRNPKGQPLCQLKPWLKRRLKQIFVPYFIFGLFYIIFINGLYYISGNKINLLNECISLITMQGVASMWFLPVFFFSEMFFVFFIAKLSNILQALFIIITIFLLTQLQYNGEMPTDKIVRLLLKILVALSFVILGNRIGILFNRHIPFLLLMISLLITSLISLYNGFVGIGALLFGNVILFFITGFFISYSIIMLFKVISNNVDLSLLNLFGANSIIILVTNNLFIEVFRLLEYNLFNNFFLENGFIGGLLMTIILIIPEYYLICLSKGKVGIIFGKVINKT